MLLGGPRGSADTLPCFLASTASPVTSHLRSQSGPVFHRRGIGSRDGQLLEEEIDKMYTANFPMLMPLDAERPTEQFGWKVSLSTKAKIPKLRRCYSRFSDDRYTRYSRSCTIFVYMWSYNGTIFGESHVFMTKYPRI